MTCFSGIAAVGHSGAFDLGVENSACSGRPHRVIWTLDEKGVTLKRFALLGEELSYSASPALHKAIYRQLELDDASYRTVELPTERLKSFFAGFRVGGFDGVNVTIPHKAAVMPLLDEIDSKAKLINAVNCINRRGNKLTGFNTDLLGFAYSLRQNSVKIEDHTFAVIGAGGAALAVAVAIAEGGAKQLYVINRSGEAAAKVCDVVKACNDQVKATILDADKLGDVAAEIDCIINATPLGTSPETSALPLSESVLDSVLGAHMTAFDMVYNPMQTAFLKLAAKHGANTINGLEMLVAQAVYSVEIWMGGNIVTHVDINALVRDMEKSLQ